MDAGSCLLSSALSLNNSGVDAFERSDLDSALASFSLAIKETNRYFIIAHEEVAHGDGDGDGDKKKAAATTSTNQEEVLRLERVRLEIASSAASAAQLVNQDSRVALVPSGAIKVSRDCGNIEETTTAQEDPMALTYGLSATIIYNIAIAHHAKGTRKQDRADREPLSKAMAFYSRAWKILTDFGISATSRSTGHALVDVVTMSILNGQALSSLELGNGEKSQLYETKLARFAITVQCPAATTTTCDDNEGNSNGKGGKISILDEFKVFFLANALTFRPPVTAAAA